MAGVGSLLRNWLAHPLTRGRDLDDPATTTLRRDIVRSKPSLRSIYDAWYMMIRDAIPPATRVPGRVLELGSGAGYFRDFVPDAVTSEVFRCDGVDVVLDAHRMPLGDASLRGIAMTDVMHHLGDVRAFFAEATRAVHIGGVIAMIEPWVTPWSKLVYKRLHHEPFREDAGSWDFPSTGPLSGANIALPWIVFQRDRAVFERDFPQWRIETVRPMMPLRYIVTGGVSMRSFVPRFAFRALCGVEKMLEPRAAMFAHILLRRVEP